jgi:ribonuclease J
MNIKIHRGTHEIGGSCIEIWTNKTRIVVDFGMPLIERDGREFDFSKYKDLPVQELVEKRVLPDINGIYQGADNLIDGLLISHPHQDHYGFVTYLHADLKYYLGEAAFQIINVANHYTNKEPLFKNHSFFNKDELFQIGDISVTPYWMDHSAFDSYAFLIEADGKKVFYSGDFRGHGRKSKAFKWFLIHAPSNVDSLLLEGTMIGRSAGREKGEKALQLDFEKFFHEDKLNLVYTSGQNIDRLVTIYKACNATGKILVVDPYIGSMLKESSKFARIQKPSEEFKNIHVIFPYWLTKRMLKTDHKEYIYQFTKFKISRKEISREPGKYVMIVRPSMKSDLERIPLIDGGNIIYSLWEGYLKKDYTKSFIDYLKKRNFTLHVIHTSGHADIPTLKEFAETLKPKQIIPIHTFAGDQYKNIFNFPILELNDGQELKL